MNYEELFLYEYCIHTYIYLYMYINYKVILNGWVNKIQIQNKKNLFKKIKLIISFCFFGLEKGIEESCGTLIRYD